MRNIAEHRTLTYGWKIGLLFLHIIALILAIILALYFRFPADDAINYLSRNYGTFIFFILFSLPAFYIAGIYEPKNTQNPNNIIWLFLWATIGATILTIITFYGHLMTPLGRGVFLLVAFFTIVLCSLFTLFYDRVFPGSISVLRLAFISDDPLHRELIALIKSNPRPGYVVDHVINPSELQNLDGKKIDGFVLPTGIIKSETARALRKIRFNGLEIYDPLFLYGELTGQITVDYLTEQWLFSAALSRSLFHIYKIKRLLDIIVSLIGLIIFLPFFPLIALLIKIDSRGPVLYKQERVGRNGKEFSIIKLRTMIHGAEQENHAVWAKKSDPRITGFGIILRRLRIDEILQLFNVLWGDMSLVGPRPERRQFVEELSKQIPFYEERLLLQPGITGWAQVNYPYASSLEDSKKKLQYDLYYYKNISLWLDVFVLLRTLRIILTASGR